MDHMDTWSNRGMFLQLYPVTLLLLVQHRKKEEGRKEGKKEGEKGEGRKEGKKKFFITFDPRDSHKF